MVSSTRDRIGVVGVVMALGFCAVLVHLWLLMVWEQETWAQRSHENRWSFRAVPSQRGTIRDRLGRVLVQDEPSTELTLHYQRFRQRHLIGAAVHGAIAFAALDPARVGTVYDYGEGLLGPTAAVHDLLSMPARLLHPRVLEKHVASELAMTVTTVLAQASGMRRSEVYAALRQAAARNDGTCVGDVLPVPRLQLLVVAAERVRELRQLDATLRALDAQRRERLGLLGDAPPGLLGSLERMRRASLADERHRGLPVESIRRTFADLVPFDVAAPLRIHGDRHAGLDVRPSVSRRCTVAEGSALRAMLGNLQDLDRAVPHENWFDQHLASELPEDWLDDLVPAGLVDDDLRASLQGDAEASYRLQMLLQERRGVTGVEAQFDDVLMGRLGMRFVEHDSKRREQRLWSHLQVQAGDDVQLTIDLDLQRLAERATEHGWQREQQKFVDEADQKRCEAALCVLDARTGDVLAYAGAPIVSSRAVDVPGVVWQGNGSVGSVLKPFVAVEQLHAMATGRPHRSLAEPEPCRGQATMRYGGRLLNCDGVHGSAGNDPVVAIGESCNSFFYQVGLGLGEEGLARALARFGLLQAEPDSPFADCWQGRVRGLAAARPVVDRPRADRPARTPLPDRSIGYAIQASPLDIARAYAVFAVGHLPTLGLVAGERRPVVLFDDVVGELETVRDGLRACVQTGTARKLATLQELGVAGKTGTAEVGERNDENNAWFAGYLQDVGASGAQLVVCGVVYWVQDKTHGGAAAGQLVADFLAGVRDDTRLRTDYLPAGSGR